jgi:predicted F0F1-ATPase subunit
LGASTAHWPTPSTNGDNAASDNGASHGTRRHSFWRSVGYLTSLGWMIALPIGLGVVVGRVLDQHFGSGTFWTLSLLGAGVAIAALELVGAVQDALEHMPRE